MEKEKNRLDVLLLPILWRYNDSVFALFFDS